MSTDYIELAQLDWLGYRLCPDIASAILSGAQPIGLSAKSLLAMELPADWSVQKRLLGF